MKKILSISILLLFIFVFSGCKDYLDLPPKGQRAVLSLKDVKAVLSGYLEPLNPAILRGRPGMTSAGPSFIMTPEQLMMFEAYSDNIDMDKAVYTYFVGVKTPSNNELYYANKIMFNDYDTPKAIWNSYFTGVGFANTMISQINDLSDSDESLRNQMLGELYTHRAFYLFKLVQYFAPYDKADMGIPVYLETAGKTYGVTNPRKTLKESYDQIIKDLTDALALLSKTPPKSGFSLWYDARTINNLLAQVYWFKAESAVKESADYTNAKTYALAAVKNVDAYIPTNLNNYNLQITGSLLQSGYPAYSNYSNLTYSCAAFWGHPLDYIGQNPVDIPLNPNYVPLLSTTDLRYASQIKTPGQALLGKSYIDNQTGARGAFLLFQPEEAYLILAEAHYRLNESSEAVAVLNKFKGFRNAGTAVGLTGAALLQEIKNERRKEFLMRGDKRWLDLKRYGDVTITRKYTFFNKQYSVTVAPNDFHYALPIPIEELQLNPKLVANPGWVPIVF